MYRALTATEAPLSPDELRSDLEAVGIQVVDVKTDTSRLAQAVIRNTPDVVIVGCRSPSDLLFQAAHALSTLAPCPFVVFTSDGDSSKIERASDSGIHAYVVEGYARHRLLSIIQVARARFRREQVLRDELSDLSQRYEERKLTERAKGVLMRSRGVTEDEAFELLRSLAMNSRQRIGVVALSVIDISKVGEAVNKAGQLRMLSQRIVRCCAQSLLDGESTDAARVMADSVARVENNFVFLRTAINTAGYADRMNRTQACWQEVAAIVVQPADPARVHMIDEKADIMLKNAEALTEFLESSGLAPSLHVLNIAGRQRMLSQRIAKLCFLLALEPSGERVKQLRQSTAEFQAALDHLIVVPLSSRAINSTLQAVTEEWRRMKEALESLHDFAVLNRVAAISERLLETIDRLTAQYEQAMQILVGDRLGRLR
jgi:AmiR/NasT family two-component response regulator